MILNKKNCVPFQDELKITNERKNELKELIDPSWVMNEDQNRLKREFKFSNYERAWQFVGKVSILAEEQWHHPQVLFGFGYATISIWTHDADDLVESDFILASKIDLLVEG